MISQKDAGRMLQGRKPINHKYYKRKSQLCGRGDIISLLKCHHRLIHWHVSYIHQIDLQDVPLIQLSPNLLLILNNLAIDIIITNLNDIESIPDNLCITLGHPRYRWNRCIVIFIIQSFVCFCQSVVIVYSPKNPSERRKLLIRAAFWWP